MNDGSKVVFSDGFIQKTKYKFNPKKKNELLMKRFRELTQEDLSRVSTRKELARLLGYTDANKGAGDSFVGRLIKRGEIVETFVSFGENHKIINSYSFPTKDSRNKKGVKTKKAKKVLTPEVPKEKKVAESITIRTSSLEIFVSDPSLETLKTLVEILS